MSTSAVNPIAVPVSPASAPARELSVSDGFVDTLRQAIRKDAPPAVDKRDRVQGRGSDQQDEPAPSASSTTDTSTQRDTSNANAETASSNKPVKTTFEEQLEKDTEESDLITDVVMISDQAAQQAAIAVQQIATGEQQTATEGDAEAAISTTSATPSAKDSTAPAPLTAEHAATQQATSLVELAQVSLGSSTIEVQQTTPSDEVTPTSNVSAEIPDDLTMNASNKGSTAVNPTLTHARPQATGEAEAADNDRDTNRTLAEGKLLPDAVSADALSIIDQARQHDPRNSERPATPSVEPLSTLEDSLNAPEAEVDKADLQADVDPTPTATKERTAPTSSHFQTLLDRATSLASHRTTSSELAPHNAPHVDAQRFVNRVSRAFQIAEHRGGPLQLRLSPPELGALKIELSIQQGTLTAKLETETAAAKSVLLDNLPALRERLAAQEIRIDKFEVDVRQQNSGEQPNWHAQQEGREAREARHTGVARRIGPSQEEAAPVTSSPALQTPHNGQFSAVA